MRFAMKLTRPRPGAVFTIACLASAGLGILVASTARPLALRADDGAAPPGAAGEPIAEVLHCPLAFAGVHLLKETPERSAVAYHYCKNLNDEINQCVLYDGTGPTRS